MQIAPVYYIQQMYYVVFLLFHFPKHNHFTSLSCYFVTKIVLTYCEKKNCSSDQDIFLKFQAEGQEFAKCLRSLVNLIKQ